MKYYKAILKCPDGHQEILTSDYFSTKEKAKKDLLPYGELLSCSNDSHIKWVQDPNNQGQSNGYQTYFTSELATIEYETWTLNTDNTLTKD